MLILKPLFFAAFFTTPVFVQSEPLPVAPDRTLERKIERADNVENTKAVYHGNGYWFEQHNHAGACGIVHQDTDFIVALPTHMYANGRHCGRKIEITDQASRRKVVATVADMCPTCPLTQDLDMSRGLFTQFANTDTGKLNVEWQFLN